MRSVAARLAGRGLRLRPALIGLGLLAAGCATSRREIGPPATHRECLAELEAYIRRELERQDLPGLSIALVDGVEIVWAKGFGWADPEKKVPATASTVYRVASISKLFTATAVMQQVERGRLDLDAPVRSYLPDFHPANPFGKEVTLRHLLSHHAGLLREPPVGHYFDPTEPGLDPTVESLNRTSLIYPPGARIKYSNAGPAVAGKVLEKVTGRKFEDHVQEELLLPLGLGDSSFRPAPALEARLAKGFMWTYDGRRAPAPGFLLGTGPAGNLYTTVGDLALFAESWFPAPAGRGASTGGLRGGRLRPETLKAMWTPQFEAADKKQGVGLGFFVEEFQGRLLVKHGGAIYGFASQIAALPDERLAVAVVTTLDFANGTAENVAGRALAALLARRQGRELEPPPEPSPVGASRARALAGRYGDEQSWIELHERGDELYLEPSSGFRARLRRLGERLVADDPVYTSAVLEAVPEGVRWRGRLFPRLADSKPLPVPDRWRELIGEYGWDHDVLYILERHGRLHILIEWFAWYPLKEMGPDLFRCPDGGLYVDEEVRILRGPDGRIRAAVVGAVEFPRRTIRGEDGKPFRIQPLAPPEQLRERALAARPPQEPESRRQPDLVDVTGVEPEIKLDIRYATDENFLGAPIYPQARALLQRPAAEALARAHRRLKANGYGLLVHDAYRPWYVTKMFWDATRDEHHLFVADPAKGSRHNRGCAVDLTLYEHATGRPAGMVSGYDEFSPRAFPDYPGGTTLERWHRDLLRRAMEAEGFQVYPQEWWHFDFRDWKEYPILNQHFD